MANRQTYCLWAGIAWLSADFLYEIAFGAMAVVCVGLSVKLSTAKLSRDEWRAMQALQPSPGAALLGVLRLETSGTQQRFMVDVDGVRVVGLDSGQCTFVELKPGAHRLVGTLGHAVEDAIVVPFDVAEGDLMFFRVKAPSTERPTIECVTSRVIIGELTAQAQAIEPSF